MRAHLIVNPKAGPDRGPALLPRIEQRLRPLVSALDVTVTAGEQDAIRAAEHAVRDACDLLIVGGGDGTLNTAVRGVAALPGALGRITFGLIPLGTGNDFAKALGIGEDPEGALDAFALLQVLDVDVGLLNGRPFLNISAGGFVADVSATLTEELKNVAGRLAYVIGGARALFGSEAFSTRAAVADPPTPLTAEPVDLQMFAVCNARLIGGGYPIAPAAAIDDGLFDVYLVRRTPTIEFIALLQKIAAGHHDGDSRIITFRARALELGFDRPVHVNIDGEPLEADRCEYRLLPRAARFLCGAQPHAVAAPRPLR